MNPKQRKYFGLGSTTDHWRGMNDMLLFHGIPQKINTAKVFMAKKKNISSFKANSILISREAPSRLNDLFTTTLTASSASKGKGIKNVDPLFFDTVQEDDIILITPEGQIQILFQAQSDDNGIFFTGHCNSLCVTCPQPFSENPPEHFQILFKMSELIHASYTGQIGITGGEPTLHFKELCDFMKIVLKRLPKASFSILTNGRLLKNKEWNSLLEITKKRVLFCIPLFSDLPKMHDYLVGVEGAFEETICAIQNLALYREPIEMRFVINKQNFHRLNGFSEFIFSNLPFVNHIAFMGMEYIGNAAKNLESLFIDPLDYASELSSAVKFLHRRRVNVSIFNVPLCLLDSSIRAFSRVSISSWKRGYLDQCEKCSLRESCGGIFTTSKKSYSSIKPV